MVTIVCISRSRGSNTFFTRQRSSCWKTRRVTVEDILCDASCDTGWTEEDQRRLLIEFIEENDLEDDFENYIEERAERETSDYAH